MSVACVSILPASELDLRFDDILWSLICAKVFFRKFIASSVFMLESYIRRPFFHIGVKKLVNQVINEIFRQLTLTLTLELDVPVRPMDAKGLI